MGGQPQLASDDDITFAIDATTDGEAIASIRSIDPTEIDHESLVSHKAEPGRWMQDELGPAIGTDDVLGRSEFEIANTFGWEACCHLTDSPTKYRELPPVGDGFGPTADFSRVYAQGNSTAFARRSGSAYGR